jgi:Arc/MetJ-type ribon-helix-helix transcriptional regulator
MTIELPADVEERARARVDAGEYASLDQVVRAGLEALELLEDEDAVAPGDWLAHAQQRWAQGDEAVARGEYVEGSPAELMARIRERVEKNA